MIAYETPQPQTNLHVILQYHGTRLSTGTGSLWNVGKPLLTKYHNFAYKPPQIKFNITISCHKARYKYLRSKEFG